MRLPLPVRNRLASILSEYEKRIKTAFKPNRDFYRTVDIGQKRFWQLVRNKADMTYGEMLRLSAFFQVEMAELHVGSGLAAGDKAPQPPANVALPGENSASEPPPALPYPSEKWVPKEHAMQMLGIRTTRYYELVNEGWLKTTRIGRKPLVKVESIERLLETGCP